MGEELNLFLGITGSVIGSLLTVTTFLCLTHAISKELRRQKRPEEEILDIERQISRVTIFMVVGVVLPTLLLTLFVQPLASATGIFLWWYTREKMTLLIYKQVDSLFIWLRKILLVD